MNSNSFEEGASTTHNSATRIIHCDADNNNNTKDHNEMTTTASEDNNEPKTVVVNVTVPDKEAVTTISSSQSCPESFAIEETSPANTKHTEKIRRRVDVIRNTLADKIPSKKASQPLQVLPTAVTSSPLIVSPTRIAGDVPEFQIDDVEQLA